MKAIVTVIGKDKPGIIAKVSSFLAINNINIEDITQTVIQDNFTMLMLINMSNSLISLSELINSSTKIENEIGVKLIVQHEEIFNAMHNI